VTSEALEKEDSVIEVLQEMVIVNEKGSGEKLKELTVFNTLTQATPTPPLLWRRFDESASKLVKLNVTVR
jgi:hypothetical protein